MSELSVNDLVREAHGTSKEKGWYDPDLPARSPLDFQMLMVSEIAEACEEARKQTPPIYAEPVPNVKVPMDVQGNSLDPENWNFSNSSTPIKPEGELIELADCVIRIADYCGHKGWDLEGALRLKMAYNKSRPHRHGGKRY